MLGLHLLRGFTVQFIRIASRFVAEAALLHEFNKFLGRATAGTIPYRKSQISQAEASLLKHIKAPVTTVKIPLPSGIKIHTVIAGKATERDILNEQLPSDEDNNPVILFHGHSLGGATFFRNVDDLISQGYTSIYMPDLPGFGQSSRPRYNNNDEKNHTNKNNNSNNNNNGHNAINFFLHPIIELINKLKITNFTLIGHSLGGYMAHEYSLYLSKNNNKIIEQQQQQIKIKQLILISPAAINRNTNFSTALWFRLTPQRLLTHGGLFAQLLFNKNYPTSPAYNIHGFRDFTLLSNSISTRSGDLAAASILKFERKGIFNWHSECITPILERTSKLNCPVHIIGGRFDRLVSTDSLRNLYHNMMEKGNHLAITILTNGDHASHIVEPTRFAKALQRARVSMGVVSEKVSTYYKNHQLAC